MKSQKMITSNLQYSQPMYVASPLVTANLEELIMRRGNDPEIIRKQFVLYRTLRNAYGIKAHIIDTTELNKTPLLYLESPPYR